MNNLQQTILRLNSKLATLNEENKRLRSEISHLKLRLTSSAQQTEVNLQNIKQIEIERNKLIDSFEREISTQQQTISELKLDLERKDTQIFELTENLGNQLVFNHSNEMNEVSAQIRRVRSEIQQRREPSPEITIQLASEDDTPRTSKIPELPDGISIAKKVDVPPLDLTNKRRGKIIRPNPRRPPPKRSVSSTQQQRKPSVTRQRPASIRRSNSSASSRYSTSTPKKKPDNSSDTPRQFLRRKSSLSPLVAKQRLKQT